MSTREKQIKVVKIVAFLSIILITIGLCVCYLKLSRLLEISIFYSGYGTEQEYAGIQFGDNIKYCDVIDNVVTLPVYIHAADASDEIAVFWGNAGGTVDISKIDISYLGETHSLTPEKIGQYFSLQNVDNIEISDEHIRFFSYDFLQSGASLDFEQYITDYVGEKQVGRNVFLFVGICFFVAIIVLEKRYFRIKLDSDALFNRLIQLFIPFGFAVFVFIVCTWGLPSMTQNSGDAADIWLTIKSFYTKDVYGSYVLYKGINSVYPYVWLYQLSNMLQINEWFFIRAFYCIAFAYVSAIGFPNMIELLTNRKTKYYRRCIVVILFWWFWCGTMSFTELMVDLPCLMYFVLLVNVALKLYRGEKKLWRYVLTGILCGLNMTASGQYTTPAVCIFIFTIWISFKYIKCRKDIFSFLTKMALLAVMMLMILEVNNNFETTVVEPLRQQDAWIPSGDDWLKIGLSRFRFTYRTGGGALSIPSYRNEAILIDYFGDDIPGSIEVSDYIKLFLKYPVDFALNYLNSFFLILSPDGGAFNFWPLYVFYSLAFIALCIGVGRCKFWNKIFSSLFWIGFAFLWSTVPMLVMNIEPRTCMQIQGIIIALAICDDYVWSVLNRLIDGVKKMIVEKKIIVIQKIPYTFVLYLIFMCVCFLHISTLYETIGAAPESILIRF